MIKNTEITISGAAFYEKAYKAVGERPRLAGVLAWY